MILKRVCVHNYRQHAHKEYELSGNVIVVVGPNGSGKSNLLGALPFAFIGEQPGFKKPDLLRWGQSEGHVTVDFTHNGVDACLTRYLHSANAELTWGTTVYRGATKVQDALATHMGLDKDLLKQAVFVRQAEIDEVLFTEPRTREIAFQRLLGIGEAVKIHRVLGEQLSTLGEMPNFDDQLNEGKIRYADMQSRMLLLGEQHATLQQQRAQVPKVAELQADMAGKLTMLAEVKRLITLKSQHETEEMTAQLTVLELTRTEQALKTMPTTAEVESQLAAVEQQIRDLQLWEKLKRDWETAGKAVIDLGTAPCSEGDITAALTLYHERTAQVGELTGRLNVRAQMLGALSSTQAATLTECPVCGSEVKDGDKLKAKLSAAVAELETAVRPLKAEAVAAEAKQRTLGSALAEFKRQYAVRTAAYTQADEALKAAQGAQVAGTDLTTLQTIRNELIGQKRRSLETLIKYSQVKSQSENQTRNAGKTAADILAMEQLIAGAQYTVNGNTLTEYIGLAERIQRALTGINETVRASQAINEGLAVLDGSIQELTTAMTTLDKTIGLLEFKKSTIESRRQALTTLTNVRGWFHYENGPHTLTANVLSEMNRDINTFLSKFTAPFTVIPATDILGFKCIFTDGRDTPVDPPDATMLSGGQRIQLAVAFRFASYCMFANKLGLLSLDEPTVYLDEANIGRFCHLMEQIKQVSQEMGLQVLIATHERSVIPFADTIIDLDDTETHTTVITR